MSENGNLSVFKDLTIFDAAKKIADIGKMLEEQLPSEWVRDHAREDDAQKLDTNKWLVFNRSVQDKIPAASLFFSAIDSDLKVTNIVPQTARELSKQQYNSILTEFYEAATHPVCKVMSLRCELTHDELPLTNWLTEKAAEKLVRFSKCANKSTGSAHPLDRDRWFDFLVQVVSDGSDFDTGTLEQWLITIEHWPEESAYNIILQYEFGIDLLKFARE